LTVLDSSGAVDYLTGDGVATEVAALLEFETGVAVAAPEILVVEVLSALRRMSRSGLTTPARAAAAVDDLGSIRVDLFPALPLRRRGWELRENFSAFDGLFIALAELLDEPLATKDRSLARAAASHTKVKTILLGA